MNRSATGKLHVYVVLAGLGLLGGLTLGRPEVVAIAAPFALYAALALVRAQAPVVKASSEIPRERQLEGRTVDLFIELSVDRTVPRLEVLADLPGGLVAEEPNPILIRLERGERRELEIPLRCVHWGVHQVGEVVWRAQDPYGFLVHEGRVGETHPLKVYPRGENVERLLRPLETQAF